MIYDKGISRKGDVSRITDKPYGYIIYFFMCGARRDRRRRVENHIIRQLFTISTWCGREYDSVKTKTRRYSNRSDTHAVPQNTGLRPSVNSDAVTHVHHTRDRDDVNGGFEKSLFKRRIISSSCHGRCRGRRYAAVSSDQLERS